MPESDDGQERGIRIKGWEIKSRHSSIADSETIDTYGAHAGVRRRSGKGNSDQGVGDQEQTLEHRGLGDDRHVRSACRSPTTVRKGEFGSRGGRSRADTRASRTRRRSTRTERMPESDDGQERGIRIKGWEIKSRHSSIADSETIDTYGAHAGVRRRSGKGNSDQGVGDQ